MTLTLLSCFSSRNQEENFEINRPQQPGPIEILFIEIFINHIFPFFSYSELPRLSLVSKNWQQWAEDPSLWNAFNLEKEFNLTIFDEMAWKGKLNLENTKLTFQGLNPLNNRILIPEVSKFLTHLEKEECSIEENAGLSLLAIPKKLSMNELIEIKSKSTHCEGLRVNCDLSVLEEFGDKLSEKSYWILFTNSILLGSRRPLFTSFDILAKEMGCFWPKVVEATALGIMNYVHFKHSFPIHSSGFETFAQCLEEINSELVVVGGLKSNYLSTKVWNNDEFGLFRLFFGNVGNCLVKRIEFPPIKS